MDAAGRSGSRATGPAPPAELLVVGSHLLARESSAPVPIYAVAEAIHRAGIVSSGGRGRLTALLLAAAGQAGFEVRDNFVRPIDPRAVHRRARELVASPPPPASEPTPTPSPVSRVRPRERLPERTSARHPQSHTPPTEPVPHPSRCSPPPVFLHALRPE